MFQISPVSSSNFLTRRYPECAQKLTVGCEVVFSAELALNGPIASYIVVDAYTAGGPTVVYSVREVGGLGRSVHGVSAAALHVVAAALTAEKVATFETLLNVSA
jgi:hypothetical protein